MTRSAQQTIRIPNSIGLRLYSAASRLLAPIIPTYLNQRLDRGKEDADRLRERLGDPNHPRPDGPIVWFHAASIGESISVLPVISELARTDPEITILVTTGTVTSAQVMAKRLPAGAIHQFVPIDTPKAVAGFLDHWQPDIGIWVESEFWPNLLRAAAKRAIPLALVNARMSPKSFRKWGAWPKTIRTLLNLFTLQLAQNEDVRQMLEDLGANHVQCPGNLKFVADPLPVDDTELNALRTALGNRPRWLAASTHAGEEEMAAAAHAEIKKVSHKFITLLVPRHPERGTAIADMMRAKGLNVTRRSLNEAIQPDTDVYLADTLGELGLFYRVTDIAFLGGSLVPHGGQNLLEAARLDCAIMHGPHTENFDTIYADFARADATKRVAGQAELAPSLFELLHNEKRRQDLIANARQQANKSSKILEAYLNLLRPMIADAKRARAATTSQTQTTSAATHTEQSSTQTGNDHAAA